MANLFRCPFCDRKYLNKDAVYEHMDNSHHDELHNLSPKQIYFNYTNKYALTKGFGRSVISGKPTPFNEITGRYLRFLPEEKDEYRKLFLSNMKKAGKEDIMKDMNHQKEMLAARHISGKYKWHDGIEFTYTGSYEKKFLVFMDTIMNWPSGDLMAPAPQIIPYRDEDGAERAHIPDFYISSLNLLVNIKSADNKFYRLRDLERERAQDSAIKSTNYNYIKIYDNQFEKFLSGVEEIKKNLELDNKKKVIIESTDTGDTMNVLLENYEKI